MRLHAGVGLLASLAFAAGLSSVAAAQDYAEHYVLDAFGGVHAGGGAPVISPATPYFGFDVAADIAYIPVGTNTAWGDGILVLDRFGGVHRGGALVVVPPGGPPTPYFGFDAARALVSRDVRSRLATADFSSQVDVSNTGFLTLYSADLNAPDHGKLMATATIQLGCASTSSTSASIEIRVRPPSSFRQAWREDLSPEDCAAGRRRTLSVTGTYDAFRGVAPIWIQARKAGGSNTPRIHRAELTILYVDLDGEGY